MVAQPFGRILLATVALVAAAAIGSNLSASESHLGLASRVVVTGPSSALLAYLIVVFTLGALEHRGRQGRPRGPSRRPAGDADPE